jgi:thiol-disulfide isomerase/thioredoxin
MKKSWFPFLAPAGLLLACAFTLPVAAQDKPVQKPPVQKPDEKPVETPAKPEPLKVGALVDEKLAMQDFDGKSQAFKELRGKTVILHFWSHLCPAEIHGDPVFVELEKHYAGNKDVVILGICSNQNELGEAPGKDADYSKLYLPFREQMKKKGLTHRMFADHGNKLSALFGAKTTPTCYVLDAKGTLVYAGALDDDPRGDKGADAKIYVRDAADAVLAGKEVAVKTTKSYG